jgi:hypothetical protein
MPQERNVRRMAKQKIEYVQGFLFTSTPDDPHHRTVCQIIGRVGEEGALREAGAMFKVEFGDGSRDVVAADDLSPWFPTD